MLAVDADVAIEEDEETVDLEDVVVCDGGFVEDDADADRDAVRVCDGIGRVEVGRLSRCSWWKDRRSSLSRSSTSLSLSCSLVRWVPNPSCDPHLSYDDVLEVEARSE